MSRIDKVSKNIQFAIPAQAAFFLINFVVRRVFTQTLTQEYLGLNGLFADILKMLSLAELGFGGHRVERTGLFRSEKFKKVFGQISRNFKHGKRKGTTIKRHD